MIPIPSARDLHLLKRASLQKLCKAHGIKANTKNQKMIIDLVTRRQELGYPEEEDDILKQSALEQHEVMDEPVRKRGKRRRKQKSRRTSHKGGSQRIQVDDLQGVEESCSSRTVSTRSTPAPDSADIVLSGVEESLPDPISSNSSPVPKSSPHPSTEPFGDQNVSGSHIPSGLSPVPCPGLGPSECQEPSSVDQIPSGTHSEQMILTRKAAPDKETPLPMITEATVSESTHTVNSSGHVRPELTEQPEGSSVDPLVGTADFNNSNTKVVETQENSTPGNMRTSLDGERKGKYMLESENKENLETEAVVSDMEQPTGSTEGDNSPTNRDDEIMLNTTYTISPPEGHLEDPQSVLSESLSKTPKQTDSPLLGTWGSSGSSPLCDIERKGISDPSCDIKDLVRARSQLRDSPLVSTWATSSTKPAMDKENQQSQSNDTHNEMMELLNARVQERLNDGTAFEKELEKTKEETAKSRLALKSTKEDDRYSKAHSHLFDRMESITSTCERKRKIREAKPTSVKKVKLVETRPSTHKQAKPHMKQRPGVATITPRLDLSATQKKVLNKSSSKHPPFRC